MRILQVIHQFPPYSWQGSEVYCDSLSRELARSEDVRVFHLSNASHHWWRRLRRETVNNLETYHCVDGRQYARLAGWPNRFLRRSFGKVLDEFRPDVVHFHNFLSLGDDLVALARASGGVVVYTLHDYGLICPNALLLRDDGVLCGKQDPEFFRDCCPVLIRTGRGGSWAQFRARLPSLARWQLYARQHSRPVVRAAFLSVTGRAARVLGDPRRVDLTRKREFFLTHTRSIIRDVARFFVPSRFLLRRYASCGVPEHKMEFMRYGFRQFASVRNTGRAGVRFGYIGALHPQKGVELLLEAFREVDHGASLHIFGSVFGSPISKRYVRRIRDRIGSNVFLHGAYDNQRVGEVLAGLDVVVVPSVWYENSPLTIQEAFIARVPVITADAGGMAELVRDGIDGLHFQFGNVRDLRAKLVHVVNHPEILDRLRDGILPVPGIAEHAAALRARYEELAHGPARDPSPVS